MGHIFVTVGDNGSITHHPIGALVVRPVTGKRRTWHSSKWYVLWFYYHCCTDTDTLYDILTSLVELNISSSYKTTGEVSV